ncbi:MAG: hypothetical protein IT271_12465 [Chitinophagales bacterium]|nr:hypothetical protein [Chitinophagales bacterium]
MAAKSNKLVTDKRVRTIQEWIIDDWAIADIKAQILVQFKDDKGNTISTRQAERYIKEARERWNQDEDDRIDRIRRKKIEGLKKLKRSLGREYVGTPSGMNAVLRIEREITKLEGSYPAPKPPPRDGDGIPIVPENLSIVADSLPEVSTEELLKFLAKRANT